jgi:riboflavin kinase/FMN adenylyltransferase
MKVITDIRDIADTYRGSVAALGNFDGVHGGHKSVIAEARARASELRAPLSVVCFEPHPRQYFRLKDPPFRLSSLHGKTRLLEALGVDVLFALRFDRDLAEKSAQDFVFDDLGKKLGLVHVVVGADFRFGKGRDGDMSLLSDMGVDEGFGVSALNLVKAHKVNNDDEPLSSTKIRAALREGRVGDANALLGRPWAVDGTVMIGNQRGRTIGFPTANINLGAFLHPALGGYIFRVEILDGPHAGIYGSVGNIGVRPTFGGDNVVLEAHIFDFDGDIYDSHIYVYFVDYLRPEQKFDGIESLVAQIEHDSEIARDTLENWPEDDIRKLYVNQECCK